MVVGVKKKYQDKDLEEEFLVALPEGLMITAFYTERRFSRKRRVRVDGKLKTVEEVVKRRAGNEMFALSKSGQYKARRIFNPGISRSKADPAVRYWLELVDLSNPKEFVIVGTLESRLQRMGVVEKVSTPKRLATGTSGS